MHIVKKRLICTMFKGGKSVFCIAGCAGFIMYTVTEIENVIRDAMNGKFQLEAAPKRRRLSIKMLLGFPCGMVEIVEPKKRRKAQ